VAAAAGLDGGFSSAEMTNSLSLNGCPCQVRAYRSSTFSALVAKSGSRRKIQDWYCHGLRASSANRRRTVADDIEVQIPSVMACCGPVPGLHESGGVRSRRGKYLAGRYLSFATRR